MAQSHDIAILSRTQPVVYTACFSQFPKFRSRTPDYFLRSTIFLETFVKGTAVRTVDNLILVSGNESLCQFQ